MRARFGTAPAPRSMAVAVSVSVVVVAAGLFPAEAGPASPCRLPDRFRTRVWRGYDPGRSGEIQLVARGRNVVGAGFPHAGPQDHLQDVPLLLYGPGVIASGQAVDRPATSADIVPTQARLLGADPGGVDGAPLEEAILPGAPPPAVIVTIVWDAGGRVVLDEYPEAWPELRALRAEGTWYGGATVGSSPSTSAAIHGTIGTGTFPKRHGLTGTQVRVGGRLVQPWRRGPRLLREPTFADRLDADRGNAPVVAAVGSAPIQLALIGHGSLWPGGDQDLAVLKGAGGYRRPASFWGVPGNSNRFFDFPSYVNDLPPLTAYHEYADRFDGRNDGRWLGRRVKALRNGWDTPARIPFETRVIEELIRREGFGDDDVPDLLYVNYKLIDLVSHEWSMHSPQMRQAVRAHDAELPRLVELLDQEVGEGRWAMILTADHGATPNPRVTGGWPIDTSDVAAHIRARFDDGNGRPLVQQVQPTQVFLDRGELPPGGVRAVARFAAKLTEADTPVGGNRPRRGRAGRRVFAAAFPSSALRRCVPKGA